MRMSTTTIHYFGNFVYDNGYLKYYFADGYTDGGGENTVHYYIRDHQGNNHVVAKYDGTIEQTTHYYPYGGILSQSTNQGVQKYKYNGKEYDTMHGLNMYDYGARQQDPAVGMFTSMDPLCEKYYNISPYMYCAGNPVNYIDPTGEYIAWFDENMNEWTYNCTQGGFVNKAGELYNGDNEYIKKITSLLTTLRSGYNGNALVEDLANREEGVMLCRGEAKKSAESAFSTPLDANIAYRVGINFGEEVDGCQTDFTTLGHEFAHSQDRLNGTMDETVWFKGGDNTASNSEKYAMHIENLIRAEHNIPIRKYYIDNGEVQQGACCTWNSHSISSLYFTDKFTHRPGYTKIPNNQQGYVYKKY